MIGSGISGAGRTGMMTTVTELCSSKPATGRKRREAAVPGGVLQVARVQWRSIPIVVPTI